MVPRITKAGRSFKGAGLYYLHDKNAETSNRVTFTDTVNLPTDDADKAIAHMIDTAVHSDDLKRSSGHKVTRSGTKPVYCYSLAWHPDQTPSQEQQLEAAHETLKLLGLEAHQAMIVGHNDTEHPHVHVIANRVHPETGLYKKMGNDKLKLSAWAEAHENEYGRIYCEERVKNNAARGNRFVKDQSPTRRQYYQVKKAASDKLWQQYRSERDQAKGELKEKLDSLWQWRQNKIKVTHARIKKQYKPQWAKLLRHQAKEVLQFDQSFMKRFHEAKQVQEKSLTSAFTKALFKNSDLRQNFLAKQKSYRLMMSNRQKAYIAPRIANIDTTWKAAKDKVYTDHKRAQKAKLDATKETSNKIWKDKNMTPARRLKQHDKEQVQSKDKSSSIEDTFNQEARMQRIEKAASDAKKRRKRSKDRKRYRGKDDGRTRGR